ncbi:hypothetical protein A3J90_07895 [candidate division WOR-1 bacterium RIFOXYC2_FULL_37_10]|uniref:Uncharacterized protein n=1 Tax=candidate division WOR-1 bacterium RIFOXYB2_FULL_37_13 TaxID=1802579 RepID=A0A1F4SY84_UNCSA|nr:MAG: hypothetical protein A2310_01160 [candidate division WOR-1 bacterium RIFOXYB2_FULL_37_13]OGC36947.1 MAG: hypothetical protein A3J90_07895 [candidate division WOR-1 bacterium RIFOXYC2_FULL_37_10]
MSISPISVQNSFSASDFSSVSSSNGANESKFLNDLLKELSSVTSGSSRVGSTQTQPQVPIGPLYPNGMEGNTEPAEEVPGVGMGPLNIPETESDPADPEVGMGPLDPSEMGGNTEPAEEVPGVGMGPLYPNTYGGNGGVTIPEGWTPSQTPGGAGGIISALV